MKGSLHNKCLLFVILGTLVFCLSYDTTMYCVSWPTEICWRCRASKGNECFDTVYTDFSSTAGWRSMGSAIPGKQSLFLLSCGAGIRSFTWLVWIYFMSYTLESTGI